MKSIANGLLFVGLSITLLFFVSGCSESAPDPVADPTHGLLLLHEGYAPGSATRFRLYSREELSPGYNEVFFFLSDSLSGKPVSNADIKVFPLMDMGMKTHSCPHENPVATSTTGLYAGAIMFSMPSGDMGTWNLQVAIQNKLTDLSGQASFGVTVHSTSPSRIYSFLNDNSEKVYVALHFPAAPKVGVNDMEVIVYRSVDAGYLPVDDLSITMLPEMPSMDHGSPNNQDPVHEGNGHYKGKANFTMTGEWRINLEFTRGDVNLKSLWFDVLIN